MKTTCDKHSESLLLLVHNELSGWPRLQVETHLLVCRACRAKESRLRSLSTTLAISLKNPRLGSRTFRRPRRAIWATLGLGAASAAFLGSQLVGAQFLPAATFGSHTGDYCEKDQAPVMAKHVPPSVPKPPTSKPPAKSTISGTSKRECRRELR
jgi:anti-sigma factor RsiW